MNGRIPDASQWMVGRMYDVFFIDKIIGENIDLFELHSKVNDYRLKWQKSPLKIF